MTIYDGDAFTHPEAPGRPERTASTETTSSRSAEEKNRQCVATETVQIGGMVSMDLRCTLNSAHWHDYYGGHVSTRQFGIVKMEATWPGGYRLDP